MMRVVSVIYLFGALDLGCWVYLVLHALLISVHPDRAGLVRQSLRYRCLLSVHLVLLALAVIVTTALNVISHHVTHSHPRHWQL